MAIRDLPRPLPECGRCGNPVRRTRWMVTGGLCTGCMSVAETMAAKHREIHVAQLGDGETTRRRATDDRIAALAAKRQARQTA